MLSPLDTWYALAVRNGQERSIREEILKGLDRAGVRSEISEIVFPDEEVTVDAGSPQQRTVRRGVLPGYLLVRGRRVSELALVKIADTKGVLGFMGGNEHPTALRPNDLDQILGRAGKPARSARARFAERDQVRIMRGPMSDFTGEVSEVNPGKQTATVTVEIFGRATPVSVSFADLTPVR